jgi:hypothetical protein
MPLQRVGGYGSSIELEPRAPRKDGTSVIDSQPVERHWAVGRSARPACLVSGCTCRDARIVSTRRAAFFAAQAKGRGETAHRVIVPDPAWSGLFATAD